MEIRNESLKETIKKLEMNKGNAITIQRHLVKSILFWLKDYLRLLERTAEDDAK